MTAGGWLLAKKIQATNVTSAHIVGERIGQQQRPNGATCNFGRDRRSRR